MQFLKDKYKQTPLIIGHRGASGVAPMNTLAAFSKAIELGADGIELDVHLSKDGHPVIVHDYTIDHTTNGTGQVHEYRLDELKAFDAGSWFAPKFANERIPTLSEVFETVGQQLFINVEIKPPVEPNGLIERVVYNVIQAHKMQENVIVSSFDPAVIRRFRQLAPEIALAFLIVEFPTDDIPDCEALHPDGNSLTASDMEKVGDKFVNVWTVNDPDKARELRDMGVHGIVTDIPDVIRDALKDES